ncbi:MAG TPA: hypothetical protein VMY06_06120, partial [Sedimentisphaerales bacterium]|nr:hypothetical protein [Sedimentisphaerales bacterium]
MTDKEIIEERLEKLGQAIGSDDSLVENVMSCIDAKPFGETKRIKKLSAKLIARRIIMNRFTKFAAAAAIIVAAVLSITILDKSATPAYAVTDLPELFEQAKVIHIQGWQYFGGHRMPNGKKIPPVEIDNWIDLENGRSRYTGTGLSIDKNGVRVTVAETISDGQYQVNLNHTERYATFFKISDYQQMLDTHYRLNMMSTEIFGDLNQLDNFAKVGQEEIDGVEYDIWEGEVKHSVAKHADRYKYWLLPSTGELRRVRAWTKLANGQWALHYEYHRVEHDVELPEEIFTMEVPEGYELRNTMETAILQELDDGGSVHCGSLTLDPRTSFTLSDGSVILGWHSVDRESQKSQAELFEGLEFG